VLLLAAAVLLGAALPGAAQPARPALVAELSVATVEITTGFTGAEVLVFGATERMIGAGGDEVLVVATGPSVPMVVRRRVNVLGFWINGPAATFPSVPGFYAIAGSRPAWQVLPAAERAANRLGLDELPLSSTGAPGPGFRAALLELKQGMRLWVEDTRPVEVSGGHLFHARLPFPATVQPGDYRIDVLLVRNERVIARQELPMRVQRVGSAAQIAEVAHDAPIVYGLICIVLAALAGWVGSILFRRG
jgi:uncharacterized protein (TIGR02186 family)